MPPTARGASTRRLIVERSSLVFEKRGYVAATLNELVAATGLSRGAFYFHFESKESVALAVVEAQAARWPRMVAEIEQEEPEPLRRLLRLVFRAAEAVQGDPMIRAAHRLMAERAAVLHEAPGTFSWWVDTIGRYLTEAESRHELPDLASLVPEGSAIPPVTALAEYIVSRWAGVQQAALASGRTDLSDRVYTSWVVLLPWLGDSSTARGELLELMRELHAGGARGNAEPVPTVPGDPLAD